MFIKQTLLGKPIYYKFSLIDEMFYLVSLHVNRCKYEVEERYEHQNSYLPSWARPNETTYKQTGTCFSRCIPEVRPNTVCVVQTLIPSHSGAFSQHSCLRQGGGA